MTIIPYSPEQAPPVKATMLPLDILAIIGGAYSGDYSICIFLFWTFKILDYFFDAHFLVSGYIDYHIFINIGLFLI